MKYIWPILRVCDREFVIGDNSFCGAVASSDFVKEFLQHLALTSYVTVGKFIHLTLFRGSTQQLFRYDDAPLARPALKRPLLPMALTFSRRSMYSHQASWVTSCLFGDGIARNLKVSRLFTAGKRAALILLLLSARGEHFGAASVSPTVQRATTRLLHRRRRPRYRIG